MKRTTLCRFAVAALAVVATGAFAQASVIRGVVVAVDGRMLHVRAEDGQTMDLVLPGDARVSVRAPASLAAIRQGEFVGATAKPGANGTLVASEVHIFPESMRGTGEGHRPMASLPGSTMTNATVASVSGVRSGQRSMTNATVAGVGASGDGKMLHLTYKGGEQRILVPPGVPVVTFEPGSLASLSPGAHVIVYATTNPDGRLAASRIGVGKNGSVPPI